MAILVVFSTVSFTVEKHFCGDTLIDVSIFSAVEKCSETEGMDAKTPSVKEKSCCNDTVDLIKGQDELTVTALTDLEHAQQVFLVSYAYAFLGLFESLPKQIIPHKNYSPPNLVADIQVRDQVFLI